MRLVCRCTLGLLVRVAFESLLPVVPVLVGVLGLLLFDRRDGFIVLMAFAVLRSLSLFSLTRCSFSDGGRLLPLLLLLLLCAQVLDFKELSAVERDCEHIVLVDVNLERRVLFIFLFL